MQLNKETKPNNDFKRITADLKQSILSPRLVA